jgi:hypothetical protein
MAVRGKSEKSKYIYEWAVLGNYGNGWRTLKIHKTEADAKSSVFDLRMNVTDSVYTTNLKIVQRKRLRDG